MESAEDGTITKAFVPPQPARQEPQVRLDLGLRHALRATHTRRPHAITATRHVRVAQVDWAACRTIVQDPRFST